jgi:hypothetical protein
MEALAKWDFEGNSDGLLSYKRGDILKVAQI